MPVVFFKKSSRFRPLKVASDDTFVVSVQVIAVRDIERVRWYAQWGVMAGGGGRALDGFTNEAARRHEVHTFIVKRKNLAKCIREFGDLLEMQKVVLMVDGERVKLRLRIAA